MTRIKSNNVIWLKALLLAILLNLVFFKPARADVAPPESPPGVVILPGVETTQVRMVSEIVTLAVISNNEPGGKAKTTAEFLMKNLGQADEKMEARFPLVFGEALYYQGVYPEITDFKVLLDGSELPFNRITSIDDKSGEKIPWASFSVNFPAGKDVKIRVSYTAQGFGYEPLLTFRYILETGAGWMDTIGSGDIILQLPYPASAQNVLFNKEIGFSKAAGLPVYSGNTASWHFENLEPGPGDNFEVEIISPLAWKKVLTERENTTKNPQDGEAWGRLGKAIKEAIRYPKGFLREDRDGIELYQEAVAAYEKAVTLLPKDALWHYGFADLLWSHYLYSVYFAGSQAYTELIKLETELRLSLQLDPSNQNANDLALWVSGTLPWALSQQNQQIDFLALTATPTYAPPSPTVANELTSVPEFSLTELPTIGVLEEDTPTPFKAEPTRQPVPLETTAANSKLPAVPNPLCGSALLIPALVFLGFYVSKRQ